MSRGDEIEKSGGTPSPSSVDSASPSLPTALLEREIAVNILRMVKEHTKRSGWPKEAMRLGPGTCGQTRNGNKGACRTAHAYAEAVKQTSMFDETFYTFVYDRPCNAHEAVRDPNARKKVGLSEQA